MTNDEFIGIQAKKIMELEAENERLESNIQKAINHMVCIGGPLNDNILGFNKEQKILFHRIRNTLEES